MFSTLLPVQWFASIFAAIYLSPLTWKGTESSLHPHLFLAIFVGGLVTSLPLYLTLRHTGETSTRHVVAISQMLMSGILIHVSGGRIETHFHIFGSLAFLSFYRDWRVLISATIVTALDHLVRGWLYPFSVYGVLTGAEWRWLEHAGWVVFTDVFSVVSCLRSVREMRLLAERTAAQTCDEERYRAVVEQTTDGIALIDPGSFAVIECNDAFSRLLGFETIDAAKASPGHAFEQFMHPDSAGPVNRECEFVRANGSPIAVAFSASFISFNGRRAICLTVKDNTARNDYRQAILKMNETLEQRIAERTAELVDANAQMQKEVSERKAAESELSDAKEFLYAVIDNVPSMIFVKDSVGRYVLGNQALAAARGAGVEELIGKTRSDFGFDHEEGLRSTREDVGLIESMGARFIPEERVTDAEGNVRWYQTSKRAVAIGKNGARYLVGVSTDLTERKHIEGQLQHAQKMESIGQLAAGIAHEINTPTQYVGDNVRFVRDAFRDIDAVVSSFETFAKSLESGCATPESATELAAAMERADLGFLMAEVPAALEQSLDGVSRIAKIVQSMKEFAHPGCREKQLADINRAIESTVTVARNEWKYVADLETNFDPALPAVPCYLGEFNQAILNMVINAAHAIGDVVGDGSRGRGRIVITTSIADDRWAEVRIADSGGGIPPEIRNRVFDPFFTTKQVGKGSGQGLAISHAVVVEKHGGRLTFESEQGKGTEFIIRLPLGGAEGDEKGGLA